MSSVGSAVTMLARAVDVGTSARAACSAADGHARTMLQVYTQIAEDSGQDAPNAARRDVFDAQNALLEASNRLHHAAQTLRDYVDAVAPSLAGSITTDSEYRPTGAELLQLNPAGRPGRGRGLRLARVMTENRDDLSESTTQYVDGAMGAREAFGRLPDPPSVTGAETRQPHAEPIPVMRPADTHVSYGGITDAGLTVAAIVLGWRQFRRRRLKWFRRNQ
jgi:hypothetical protein